MTDDIRSDLKALERLKPRSYFIRLASLFGIGTLFDAFDSALIGSVIPALIVYMHIGLTHIGPLAASIYIGEFFGAFIFGVLSERIGRKGAYVVAMIEASIFIILTGLAWNYSSLYAFRLISGIGLGGEVPVAIAMVNEFAPTMKRALIVQGYESLFGWGLFIAPLTAAAIYSLMGEQMGWRVLFFLGAIPLLAAIVSIFAVYESPRWLLNKGRTEEARAVIKKLQAKSKLERQDARMAEVDKEIDNAQITPKKTSWTELFSKQYRRRTGFNWVMWGTIYFINYGLLIWLPTEYIRVGHLPTTMSLILTAAGSGSVLTLMYVLLPFLDQIGRRPIFISLYSLSIIALAYGTISALVYHDVKWQALFTTAIFCFVGTGFMSSFLYVYSPELFPTRMRAWATSAGSAVLRAVTIVALTIVPIILAAGGTATYYIGMGHIFLMFLVVGIIGLIVFAIFGIETKQKVLEQLSP